MFRSTRNTSTRTTIICTALALSTLAGGHALAQRREAPRIKAEPRTEMPSLGEAGVVLDFANAQPEFREALRPKNTDKIRELLRSYGLSDKVKVYDGPMETIVPGGPYTNCHMAPMTVYYPAPTYSWPNHPRTIFIVICNNIAGGQTGFNWD